MNEDELQDRRRSNLRTWVDSRGGPAKALALRQNIPNSYASYIAQVLGGYSFGSRAARTCEARLGMPSQWLDQDRSAGVVREPPAAYAASRAPDLPAALSVLGAALAIDMADEVRDDIADALAKLARRRGSRRDQEMILTLLTSANGKPQRQAA